MKKASNLKRFVIFLLIMAFTCGSLFLQACSEKEDKGTEQDTLGEEITEPTPEPTPAPTPEPTEPPTPKPPPVTEVVLKWTFTEDAKMFKTGNMTSDFRVEDGLLKMTSTGGDPFIFAVDTNMGVNAADVDLIRFKIKNNADGYGCQLFFITVEDSNWSEMQSMKNQYWFCDGEDWEILEFDTSDCDVWEGTIKTIRFDYLETEGDIEIEYMSFEKIVG